MTNIIVNYRREDVPAEARRIRNSLAGRFGGSDVVAADDEATDEATSRRQLGAGGVLIAVIGPRWLELTRGYAVRGERDDVRAEIATALRRGLTVIPVRVGRADAIPAMPRAEDLPEDIRALAQLPSRTISVERFEADTMALSQTIRPPPVVATRARMPGNSSLKLWIWAAGIMASTVLFANLLVYLTGTGAAPSLTQAGGRLTAILQSWTAEGRIRRAIETALAKGRHPEEARRCQSALIAATDTGTIIFNTASADLDQRSHQTLDGLARIIRECPDFVVEVDGHTDNAGDPAANQRLSERRAFAVRDYLMRAGVPIGSLGAVGYGETRPIAPNDTPANMARNRRIEFSLTVR